MERVSSTNSNSNSSSNNSSGTIMAFLRWLLQTPVLLLFAVFALFATIQYSYESYVIPIIQSYKRGEMVLEFYDDYRNEFTYYNRHCTASDISTRDANDLLITPQMSPEEAANRMLQHGAAAVKNVLTKDTATQLRDYLANKHAHHLDYNEVFWQEQGRLALGLGTHDHPAIAKALEEVGSHALLKQTLEAILGPNPAMSEISTLTSMTGNEDQYLHSDSDYFGSSLLYGQSFLHSYSMFIALQDTTQTLGATMVCPGTHFCADEDLAPMCYENGAFSMSTNGKTGPRDGLMEQGDALLFNQNIFHGGPGNRDPSGKDRIMFIISFVSSKQSPQDLRRQGLGTYYYQRWNMWGHTFDDLKNASTVMVQPWGALRALGLLPAKGVTWIHQFAQQIANKDDFYADGELEEFKEQFLDFYHVPSILSSKATEWEPFIQETMALWVWGIGFLSLVAFALYIVMATVVYIALNDHYKPKSPFHVKSLLIKHLLLGIFFFALVHHIDNTELAKSVTSGQVYRRPFDNITAVETGRPTTFPERNDVLFSARLQEADHLASYKRFLNYHKGNQQWRGTIANATATTPTTTTTTTAEDIVQQLLQTSEGGIHTRFLRQNVATGLWEIMTRAEAVYETAVAMGEQDPTRILLLAQENDNSDLTCPVQRKMMQSEMYEVGDKIWAWDESVQTFTEAILTGIDENGVFSFDYFIPDEEGQLAGQGKPEEDDIRPYVAYQSGDRVGVDYHGTGEKMFPGTLLRVHPDGTCSVQCDDGEYIPRVIRSFLMPLYDEADGSSRQQSMNDAEKEEQDDDEEEFDERVPEEGYEDAENFDSEEEEEEFADEE